MKCGRGRPPASPSAASIYRPNSLLVQLKQFGWGRGRVLYSLSWQNVRYKLYRKVFEFCLSSEMTIADKRSFCLANNNSDGKSIGVFLL